MCIRDRDKEDVIKIGLKYGTENPYGMTRNYPASDFYRIGQTVTVNAPSFRDNGKVYVSKDKSQTLTLKEKNTLDFYYYLLEAQIRMPVLELSLIHIWTGKCLCAGRSDRNSAEGKSDSTGDRKVHICQ